MLQPLPGSMNGQKGSSWEPTAARCLCERGGGKRSRDAQLATLPLLEPREKNREETALLALEVLGTAGFRANSGIKTKDSPPGPPPGEGEVQSPSPNEQSPPSLGRPSQGLLHLRLPPVLVGCGRFHTSLTFSAARESIAIISGSGSDNATTPEGGNAAGSSSPERESSPSDAAIDISSSGEAPKETGGVPHSAEVPARSNSKPTGCGALEG